MLLFSAICYMVFNYLGGEDKRGDSKEAASSSIQELLI